jgi:hypothetical protein
MTAITAADATSVDIPVHLLQNSTDTLTSGVVPKVARIGLDGRAHDAHSSQIDGLVEE